MAGLSYFTIVRVGLLAPPGNVLHRWHLPAATVSKVLPTGGSVVARSLFNRRNPGDGTGSIPRNRDVPGLIEHCVTSTALKSMRAIRGLGYSESHLRNKSLSSRFVTGCRSAIAADHRFVTRTSDVTFPSQFSVTSHDLVYRRSGERNFDKIPRQVS